MDEEALSIYFALEQGSRADIEVIASALISLSKAIKDVSFYIDPSLIIRVEVIRGADGSLFVDLVIKVVKYITPSKDTLKGLPIVILSMLGNDMQQYAFEKSVEHAISNKDQTAATPQMDEGTKHEISQPGAGGTITSHDIEQNDVGGIHIRNFYGTLYLDPNITGVGATRTPGRKPDVIVRRHDFPVRAHLPNNSKITEVRVNKEEMRVTLISPMLVAGHRKWRFKGQKGEFSAPINDNDFQRKFLAGQTAVKLQAGIDMDVVVSVLENKIDGVWHVASREIIEVKGFRPSQHQGSFDLGEQ